MFKNYYCEVCKTPAGGRLGHPICAKVLQEKYKNKKRKKNYKIYDEKNINEFIKILGGQNV